MVIQAKAPDLEKQARFLLSIACLVKDAAKHDELQQKANALLVASGIESEMIRPSP
jgi:hypothetical protein